MNLFGDPQSLIEIKSRSSYLDSFGILVGSTSQPPNDKDAYSGEMNIDNSVNVSIFSNIASGSSYGVYFDKINAARIHVDGIFMVNVSETYHQAYGVYFNNVLNAAHVNIDGIFTVGSRDRNAYGVYFNNDVNDKSIITINGIFIVIFVDIYNSYGVFFSGVADVNDSVIIIDGVFTVNSSNGNAFGVYFGNASDSVIEINGIFTINATAGGAYGVVFFYVSDVTNITIDGIFTVNSSTSSAFGINFYNVPSSDTIYNTILIPQFFSKKNDTGDLKIFFPNALYGWNGSISNIFGDSGLSILPVVAQGTSDF
jgi:hypothetical protein